MRSLILAPLFVLALFFCSLAQSETIEFDAEDGLAITADTYISHSPDKPMIVLFHQAQYSRGEYLAIAPKLNQMGFNAIAIDQRSGQAALGVTNETAKRAQQAGLATRYTDALPDMVAALRYARQQYPQAKLIAWGSSYSAALVIKIAGDHPQLVDGLLAFSPGEYFARLGERSDWIQNAAKHVRVPVFITSARDEANQWVAIEAAILPALRSNFLPESTGKHGSKALWEQQADHQAYWDAVAEFLQQFLQ